MEVIQWSAEEKEHKMVFFKKRDQFGRTSEDYTPVEDEATGTSIPLYQYREKLEREAKTKQQKARDSSIIQREKKRIEQKYMPQASFFSKVKKGAQIVGGKVQKYQQAVRRNTEFIGADQGLSPKRVTRPQRMSRQPPIRAEYNPMGDLMGSPFKQPKKMKKKKEYNPLDELIGGY